MPLFLELEIAYIVIGIFILVVTAIVTTYSDLPKGAFKKGMIGVGLALSLLIIGHYTMTTARMDGVEKMFNAGETIICENKTMRKMSPSILLSQKLGWRLEGHLFTSDDYERDFHTSRCIEYDGIVPE